MRQIANISKSDMEDYNLAMFTHAINFFKECASLKKPIPKHFFTSLLTNLSIEDLVTLGNLLSIEFMYFDNNFMQLQVGELGFHKNSRTNFLKNWLIIEW